MRLATEMHQKFEFYTLGLTFGVLALSVQTASWQGPLAARVGELAGWILLLVSGVTGLWRLEWSPKIYELEGRKQDAEARQFELEKRQVLGAHTVYVGQEPTPIEAVIKQTSSNVSLLQGGLDKLDRQAVRKYRVQRWSLVLGLIALMVSRGYAPLVGILRSLRP